MSSLRIMIVAGEPSGDAHAASLVRALRETAPETRFEFFGSTGAQMRDAGVNSVVNADQLAILGLWEIGRALPKFWRALADLKAAAIDRKPDGVILVDWPDFNLRLARWLHRRGVRVIYYISPQLWAWRSYRSRNIERDVDLLLSILPFEKEWYAARGMTHVEYVGHPLTGEVRARYDRAEFCRRNDLDPAKPIVALLPGSRHKELVRILPPMLDAASLVAKDRADVQFVIVIAPNRKIEEANAIAADHLQTLKDSLRIIHHETREALAAADVAAVASGTATLEAAILRTPLVIVYKESALNWHTLGSLITTEHYGLVNLIAGRRLATELIQDQFTGETLARDLVSLLDPQRNAEMRSELNEVMKNLGEPGASRRAAQAVMRFIEQDSATPERSRESL
ncbi:MAG TPA: lipid-A-disaccharide synthase [Pyrinomonadaceae bacterium]|nr:lipid-A-disaccharide synthase [Pyrinomonadaceae bacterium]